MKGKTRSGLVPTHRQGVARWRGRKAWPEGVAGRRGPRALSAFREDFLMFRATRSATKSRSSTVFHECGSRKISDAADVYDLTLLASEKHVKLKVWNLGASFLQLHAPRRTSRPRTSVRHCVAQSKRSEVRCAHHVSSRLKSEAWDREKNTEEVFFVDAGHGVEENPDAPDSRCSL